MFTPIRQTPSASPQQNNGYASDSLLSRIASQATYAQYLESETDYPVATGASNAGANGSEIGTNDGVAEIPLSQIAIYPGMAAYTATSPLITADGAPVSATGVGSWGQLYAAGRMP